MRPLVITRETDYALRILRGLQDGARRTAGDLAAEELIPQQFTYKILKKLSRAGFVQTARGAEGGCRLTADLERVSLYDVMTAMGEDGLLSACMEPGYQCPWRKAHGGCVLHCKLADVQRNLNETLKSYSLREVLSAP